MTFSIRYFTLAIAALLTCLSSSTTLADVITGKVSSVEGGGLVVTLESNSKKGNTEVKLTERTRITLNGEKAKLSDIETGQLMTAVTTSKKIATRVFLRVAKAMDDKPKTSPKPATETKPAETLSTQTAQTTSDWPQFLGPNRDNKSTSSGLLQQWPAGGPAMVWSVNELGEGYSSVSVAHGKVYTMGTQNNVTTIFALNEKTGAVEWTLATGPKFEEGQGNGPRGTPTISGELGYALDANGTLVSFNALTGSGVWRKNILNDFGGNNIVWGISESPLVDGNKVIVTPGGSRGTMVALDRMSGQVIWSAQVPQAPAAAYASVIPATIGGVKQYINFCSSGLFSVRAVDGTPLWGNDSTSNDTANCSSPVLTKYGIFSSTGYGTGCSMLEVQGRGGQFQTNVAYQSREMQNHHGGMVEHNGFIYGSSDPGILRCLDARTGNVRWENRSVGKGAITLADGHLIVRSERGPIALVEATPESYREKGRFEQPQASGRSTWPRPVVANGNLYIRDQNLLYVYNLKAN